jgi:hypothetical protein
MTVFAKVFDSLAGRMKQRKATAHERIEAAAKQIAAGNNVDVPGLEDALFTVGISLDDFRGLCDLFAGRVAKFALLETLGAARKKVEKIDREIEAANRVHAEAVENYRRCYTALRDQADQAAKAVNAARDAREWILAIENCPPSLRDDYRAALDAEAASQSAASNAQQAVRQLSDEIKSEQGWLDQLCEADAAEIHPNPIVITKAGRERMAGARAAKYDEHAARKKRLENRLADATKVADEARAGLVAAEVRVATIRKQILAI